MKYSLIYSDFNHLNLPVGNLCLILKESLFLRFAMHEASLFQLHFYAIIDCFCMTNNSINLWFLIQSLIACRCRSKILTRYFSFLMLPFMSNLALNKNVQNQDQMYFDMFPWNFEKYILIKLCRSGHTDRVNHLSLKFQKYFRYILHVCNFHEHFQCADLNKIFF